MPHVPDRSQVIIGDGALRAAIECKAHDTYTVDGDDLNKLACLAVRLDMHPGSAIPLDTDERIAWAELIRSIVADAIRRGPP